MNKHLFGSLGIVLGLAACMNACSPEDYGPCSIPDTSAHRAACSPQGENKTATCAADYVFDCDSLVCGRYESSDAFCTYRCTPPASRCTGEFCKCPEGKNCKETCPGEAECVEWIPGTGNYYCLPADKGKAPIRNNSSTPATGCVKDSVKCVGTGESAHLEKCDGTSYVQTSSCANGCAADGKSCAEGEAPADKCTKDDVRCVGDGSAAYLEKCDGTEYKKIDGGECPNGCASNRKSCEKAATPTCNNGDMRCVGEGADAYLEACDGMDYRKVRDCPDGCAEDGKSCAFVVHSCTLDDVRCVGEGANAYIEKCDGTDYKKVDGSECTDGCADDGKSCKASGEVLPVISCEDDEGSSVCKQSGDKFYEGVCRGGFVDEINACPSGCNGDATGCGEPLG